MTLLDLIAYRNGAYHENSFEWLVYRESLRAGVTAADAVVVISEDVKLAGRNGAAADRTSASPRHPLRH